MSESWDQYAEGWDTNEDVILYSEKAYHALSEIVILEDLNRLNMDSKELIICEGNGEHLRYAAHHQPRRNDHKDAQYPRFNRRRQMFCHGPRVKMA